MAFSPCSYTILGRFKASARLSMDHLKTHISPPGRRNIRCASDSSVCASQRARTAHAHRADSLTRDHSGHQLLDLCQYPHDFLRLKRPQRRHEPTFSLDYSEPRLSLSFHEPSASGITDGEKSSAWFSFTLLCVAQIMNMHPDHMSNVPVAIASLLEGNHNAAIKRGVEAEGVD